MEVAKKKKKKQDKNNIIIIYNNMFGAHCPEMWNLECIGWVFWKS